MGASERSKSSGNLLNLVNDGAKVVLLQNFSTLFYYDSQVFESWDMFHAYPTQFISGFLGTVHRQKLTLSWVEFKARDFLVCYNLLYSS